LYYSLSQLGVPASIARAAMKSFFQTAAVLNNHTVWIAPPVLKGAIPRVPIPDKPVVLIILPALAPREPSIGKIMVFTEVSLNPNQVLP